MEERYSDPDVDKVEDTDVKTLILDSSDSSSRQSSSGSSSVSDGSLSLVRGESDKVSTQE